MNECALMCTCVIVTWFFDPRRHPAKPRDQLAALILRDKRNPFLFVCWSLLLPVEGACAA